MIKNIVDLSEKRIIITGASSGIGRATARLLSELGAKCALVARNEARLQETIGGMLGAEYKYYLFDFENVDGISELTERIVSDIGQLDGMVYCAGISDTRPLKICSYQYMQTVMNINYFAYHEMIRCLAKKSNHAEQCSIVGISSCASIIGERGQSAYSASKAAMDASSRVLAAELGKKGFVINTIRPGMIEPAKSEMYQKFLNEVGKTTNELLDARQVLGVGSVDDVARVAAFLLSSSADFVTGTNIAVDGGLSSH